MNRIVVLSLFFAAACSVGEVPLNGGADGGNGDSNNAGGDGGGNGCVNLVTPVAPHLHTNGGTSNAGLNCMAVGCHNVGGAGGTFTFAGTVYTAATGAANPKGGATVKIKFGGTTLTSITDQDGNFYSNAPITYPADTNISGCPNLNTMVTKLQTGNGACNTCHALTGGTTSRMYLP